MSRLAEFDLGLDEEEVKAGQSGDFLDIDLNGRAPAARPTAATEATDVIPPRPETAWQRSGDTGDGRGRDERGHYTTLDQEHDRALADDAARTAQDVQWDSDDADTKARLLEARGVEAHDAGADYVEPVFEAVPAVPAVQASQGERPTPFVPVENAPTPVLKAAFGWLKGWTGRRSTNGSVSGERNLAVAAPTPRAAEVAAASAPAPSEPARVEAPQAAPERLATMTEAELVLAETQFTGFQTELAVYYADFAAPTSVEQIALLAQLTTELHAMQAGVEGLSDDQQGNHRPHLEFFQTQLQTLMQNALHPRRIPLTETGNYVEANRRMVDLLREAVTDGQVSDAEMQGIADQMTLANIGLDSRPGRARLAKERGQLRQASVAERNSVPIDREAHRQAADERVQRALQAVLEASARAMTATTMGVERVGNFADNTFDRAAAAVDGLEAAAVQALNTSAERTRQAIEGVLAIQALPAEIRATLTEARQDVFDAIHGGPVRGGDAQEVSGVANRTRGVFDGLRGFRQQFAEAIATIGPALQQTADTFRRRRRERAEERDWNIADNRDQSERRVIELRDLAAQKKANPGGLRGLRAKLANWAAI